MAEFHLLVPGPGVGPVGVSPVHRDPTSATPEVSSGWKIDLALIGLAGGSREVPVVVGASDAPSWLIAAASSLPPPGAEPLRCFTLGFWRVALPAAVPVLLLGGRVQYLAAAEGGRDQTYRRAMWRAATLAALSAASGGPAVLADQPDQEVEPGQEVPDAARGEVEIIDERSSDGDIERVLAALNGRHDALPEVVTRAALLASLIDLNRAGQRAQQYLVSNLQVFWAAGDDEFTEAASTTTPIVLDAALQRLDITLPRVPIDRIRLDPVDAPCVLALEGVRVRVGDRVVAELGSGAELLAGTRSAGILAHRDRNRLVCTTDDPTMCFDIPLRADRHEAVVLELAMSAVRIEPIDELSASVSTVDAADPRLPASPRAGSRHSGDLAKGLSRRVVDERPITEITAALRDRPVVVSLSHSDYVTAMGGVERRITEEASAARQRGLAYLHLSPATPNRTYGAGADLDLHVRVDGLSLGPRAVGNVVASLEQRDVRVSLVHHLMGWTDPAVRRVLGSNSAVVHVQGHDYFAICPQYTLLRNGRTYCGAPGLNTPGCMVCGHRNARAEVGPRIASLLADMGERLFISCPSPTSADIFRREFAELHDRISVSPHQVLRQGPIRTARPISGRLRLAFAGVADDLKGWGTWRRLCADPLIHDRYELIHLGLGGAHVRDRHVAVDFRAEGPNAMHDALVREAIDVVLVWTLCPETYSFVSVEAITAGALVLASAGSGNAADLVRRHSAGVVLADEDDLRELLTRDGAVRSLVGDRRQQSWTAESTFPHLDALVVTSSP